MTPAARTPAVVKVSARTSVCRRFKNTWTSRAARSLRWLSIMRTLKRPVCEAVCILDQDPAPRRYRMRPDGALGYLVPLHHVERRRAVPEDDEISVRRRGNEQVAGGEDAGVLPLPRVARPQRFAGPSVQTEELAPVAM